MLLARDTFAPNWCPVKICPCSPSSQHMCYDFCVNNSIDLIFAILVRW